jgi:hypothetical protein
LAARASVVAGIPIPSTSPVFLAVVGLHVLVGLVCVIAGAVAMLSPKRAGRHPTFGTIYYWGLVVVFLSATGLSIVRWAEDYHLFILGLAALIAASLGRAARRRRWRGWARLHITGMGTSYILLLTASMSTTARACRCGVICRQLPIGCCQPRLDCRWSRTPWFDTRLFATRCFRSSRRAFV